MSVPALEFVAPAENMWALPQVAKGRARAHPPDIEHEWFMDEGTHVVLCRYMSLPLPKGRVQACSAAFAVAGA